ncbi:MAG TPA: protein kinase [Gemmatimonadaceae bacterium]|nr:protein kinase [Gemmatimonadaceae bacterium]
MPTIKFCDRCGASCSPGVVFCATCGHEVSQGEITMEAPAVVSASDFNRTVESTIVRPGPAPVQPPPLPLRVPGPPPPPVPSHTTSMRRRKAAIPLVTDFRFVHEPINETNATRFIGREPELAAFIERVRFSDGGSFLVTGYRGVGKTSFINHALRRLETTVKQQDTGVGLTTRLVTISLNIARPVQPAELMHYIVRRLYDRLVEDGIFGLLDSDLRESLKQAYDRTSFNMARKLAETNERSYGVGEASISNPVLGMAAKFAWSRKESRTKNYEMTFLGYDDRAAEHDIITITRRLRAGYRRPATRWRRLFPFLGNGATNDRIALKVVFVFDELDKLEEFAIRKDKEDDGRPVIDHILGSLKNLFTTSGVTFVFVAGKDLQERWLEDVGRGDSVYESVFSYDKYLPCMWPDVGSICDHLVEARSPSSAELFDKFKGFLAYKGRGIPRRIVRTFNEYVEWNGGRPALAFNRQQEARIKFFAGLQDALSEHRRQLFGDSQEESTGTHTDKLRLGVYYLLDWILRQGGEFTLSDAVSASRRLSVKIALAEEIAPRVVEDLIRILVAKDYLQESQKKLDKVVIGEAGVLDEKKYIVSPRRVVEMGGSIESEEERKLAEPKPATGEPARPIVSITRIGKYSVLGTIGEGGMGVVHRATDPQTGRTVAIKLLRRELVASADAVRRFEREARVMSELRHANIVQFIDSGGEHGTPFIVMEYLDGATLTQVIDKRGRLELDAAMTIIMPVIDALRYVHERRIVRNDVKPNNVMLTPSGRVCVLDFGISRYVDPDDPGADDDAGVRTGVGMVIGTPLFMAPEQMRGEAVDRRADIYSLGVVLYNMLTRVYPFDGRMPSDILQAMTAKMEPEPPSKYAPLPAAVDAVILKCLARDAGDRYQTMSEVAAALAAAAGDLPSVDIAALVRDTLSRARAIDALGNENTITGAYPGDGVAATYPPTPISEMGAPAVPSSPVPWPMPAKGSTGGFASTPIAASRTYPPTPQGQWSAPTAAPPPPAPAPAPPVSPSASPPMERSVVVAPAPNDDRGKPAIVPVPTSSEAADVRLVPSGDGFLLKEGWTNVGRSDVNDIVLLTQKASRYHGRFVVEGGVCTVEGFDSGTGVFVNHEPVRDPTRLKPGDLVDFAAVRFVYRV